MLWTVLPSIAARLCQCHELCDHSVVLQSLKSLKKGKYSVWKIVTTYITYVPASVLPSQLSPLERNISCNENLQSIIYIHFKGTRIWNLPVCDVTRRSSPSILIHKFIHHLVLIDAFHGNPNANHGAIGKWPPMKRALKNNIKHLKDPLQWH